MLVTPGSRLDYLLVADFKVVGSVEAKPEGHPLLPVENQTDRYNDDFKTMLAQRNVPRYADELLFQYVSTGTRDELPEPARPHRAPASTWMASVSSRP